jgi:lactate permease
MEPNNQMTWTQQYLVFGHGLGVSALFAAIPICVLLILLGGMRKPAWMAGLIGLTTTFLLATLVYQMPVIPAISSALNGVAFGLFPITWIVFWAVALYRLTVEEGSFAIIRDCLGTLTPDPRLQALLIAFAFGTFLEGAAGFGAPVAIAAAMLAGLGLSPFLAAALSLIANAAGGAFGALGIPVLTLAQTTGLPVRNLSIWVAHICSPVAFIIPFYIILIMGGVSALAIDWLPALVAGLSFAAAQLLISTYLGPQLTDILSAFVTITMLVVFLRVRRAKRRASDARDCETLGGEAAKSIRQYDLPTILKAWAPYGILVFCVLFWGAPPIRAVFERYNVVFPWPFLHDVVMRTPPVVTTAGRYHAMFNLNWLSGAGTSCMIATLLSAAFLRLSPLRLVSLLLAVCRQLFLPTVTVTSVLGIAVLMNYCGATGTLGVAFASTGSVFPFFSVLLGWLGVFLTGSDTSSNALFGNLQVVTAGRLGLDPVLMASANSVGGTMGKMISLQSIAIAAAATGMSGNDQSRLFRFTLKHSAILVSIVGILTLVFSYVFKH